MGRGTLFVGWGIFVWCCAGPVSGDQGATSDVRQPGEARVAELIEELGASSFANRRRAARELLAVGAPAKAALLASRNHRDPEVRYRVSELLQTVLEIDFQLRLKAFIDDADGREDHELAGWRRFRELVGTSGPARRLFVAMQQADRQLLDVAQHRPADAGELLEERCDELQAAQQSDDDSGQAPSLGSIAAVLFVASDPASLISPHVGTCVYGLAVQDEMFKAATGGEKSQTVKRLLGAWVRRSEFVDWGVAKQSCVLAVHYRLPEGMDLARALLHGSGTPQQDRQIAIQTLARIGGKQVLPELSAFLADRSELTDLSTDVSAPTGKTLICDVVLAALVYLTDQNLEDYGFDAVQSNPVMLFDARTLGFADPEAREAALKKWHEWAKANLRESIQGEANGR